MKACSEIVAWDRAGRCPARRGAFSREIPRSALAECPRKHRASPVNASPAVFAGKRVSAPGGRYCLAGAPCNVRSDPESVVHAQPAIALFQSAANGFLSRERGNASEKCSLAEWSRRLHAALSALATQCPEQEFVPDAVTAEIEAFDPRRRSHRLRIAFKSNSNRPSYGRKKTAHRCYSVTISSVSFKPEPSASCRANRGKRFCGRSKSSSSSISQICFNFENSFSIPENLCHRQSHKMSDVDDRCFVCRVISFGSRTKYYSFHPQTGYNELWLIHGRWKCVNQHLISFSDKTVNG
jgi:hypothetical protein